MNASELRNAPPGLYLEDPDGSGMRRLRLKLHDGTFVGAGIKEGECVSSPAHRSACLTGGTYTKYENEWYIWCESPATFHLSVAPPVPPKVYTRGEAVARRGLYRGVNFRDNLYYSDGKQIKFLKGDGKFGTTGETTFIEVTL